MDDNCKGSKAVLGCVPGPTSVCCRRPSLQQQPPSPPLQRPCSSTPDALHAPAVHTSQAKLMTGQNLACGQHTLSRIWIKAKCLQPHLLICHMLVSIPAEVTIASIWSSAENNTVLFSFVLTSQIGMVQYAARPDIHSLMMLPRVCFLSLPDLPGLWPAAQHHVSAASEVPFQP